ncbi:MAG: efflux RND transporter permease subunit [Candidatus Cloacimonetes bacterium]|nr:efflux RND transporter permease subunit [Candidatus Cloacimonadota bacterium]
MNLPKFAIDNHQFTIMIIILLVIFGLTSFLTMPRSEDPQVSRAGSSVIVIYPGATPIDMEQLVVDPIEDAVNEIEDINKIDSSINDGLVVVDIDFLVGTNVDDAYSDVIEKVNSIRGNLPEDILSIEIKRWSTSNVNILQFALVSETATYRELEKEAERLEKELKKVSNVKRAETWAFPEQEVRISVDLEKIAQIGIPLKNIFGAIQSANMNIPGGNIDLGGKKFSIQTSGSYESLEDIENTVIHSDGSKIVYLKDIADVLLTYEDKTHYARHNGKRAVFITTNQKEGTNIFSVMKDIRSRLSDFEEQLPKEMELKYVFDQSESVAKRLNGFFINLLQGILLVGIIFFLAIGFRASFIVMFAIPVSIFIGTGFLDLSGYGLQQMSIAGFVITLGLLVDNAIVVTENIHRFMEMGYSRKEAAIKATSQVGWAIVSATATTVFAFIPIIMMQNMTGKFIRAMPLAVIFTLVASLFVALTLTPYLCSKLLRIEKNQAGNKFQIALKNFTENRYRKILNYALSHSLLIVILAVVSFLLVLGLFPLVGVSFFPKAEKPQLIINIETPDGTSLDDTDEAALFVESILSKKEEVKNVTTNIGRDNPQIYYNVIPHHKQSTRSQIFVELKKFDKKEMAHFVADLRKEFSNFPNARIEVKELEQGPPFEAPIAIKIIGENLDVLKKISNDIEEIYSSTSGVININNPLGTSKTDLQININREKAAMLGIQLADIDRTIRTCIAGMTISKYRDDKGKEYNIVVRLPVEDKTSILDFNNIYLTSISGAQIPLKQVAFIEFKSSPQQIDHFNLERSVTITADVEGDKSANDLTRKIISEMHKYNWPKGYNFYVSGELESRTESFGGMQKAILIAIIAVFAVLVLQFRSFTQPLVIFSALPLAIIGSVIALLITGFSFSFTAFVGLISLVGIVVNDSIILVDYTNQLRRQGKDLLSALKEAGETRFTPIILTSATTIGGLLPLTLRGGTMWAPMGWTIIGGLLTSTMLTLIVVPVLYKIFTQKEGSIK